MFAKLDLRSGTTDMSLVKQRSILESIDNQLSELLYQRMVTADEIGRIKRQQHIAVVQPQQWQQVVKRYQKHTDDAEYQEFINKFLELLHQSSIKRQN